MKKNLIYDNIHGYIEVSTLALSIIDTVEFQRMRRINQTSGLFYVFPTARHSRFEHSIGTYHIAKRFITNIKNNQPELRISDRLVEIVSIAGLCHDLGHVCFSHLFDDKFLQTKSDEFKKRACLLMHHEYRSIKLVEHIVKKYKVQLSNGEVNVICDLILGEDTRYDNWPDHFKVGKFIFEVIANKKNSLDVDKYDYIKRDMEKLGLSMSIDYDRLMLQIRVINDNICYPAKAIQDIYFLFMNRHYLYSQIYAHKKSISIELLIRDALIELDKEWNISEWIFDIDKMCKLTDEIIHQLNCPDSVQKIINKIETRKGYKMIKELKMDLYDTTKIEINQNEELFDIKVGFISGNGENPFDNIYVYDMDDPNVCSKIDKARVMLLPEQYQTRIVRIYKKT
jgi:HD superfamily phosphohydrolase